MVWAPQRAAFSAARTLLNMPPMPTALGWALEILQELRADLLHQRYALGLGVGAGIAVQHPVHVGQVDEQLRAQKVGQHGGQVVIIPEAQFIGAHGVVFIHHRDHVPIQKGVEGVLNIGIAPATGKILGGEQNLGGQPAILGKGFLIGLHQSGLTQGGGCLFFGQTALAHGTSGPGPAAGHRARRDQNHLAFALGQAAYLGGQSLNPGPVQAVRSGQNPGTHLDHDFFGGPENIKPVGHAALPPGPVRS